MFKNMINAISNPKSVFLRIRDKGYTIFLYLLLLGFIMSIPVILRASIDRESLFVNQQELSKELSLVLDKGIMIENGKLNNNDINEKFNVEMFVFVIGDKHINEIGYVISLEENGITIYFSSGQGVLLKASSQTYEKLNVDNLEFTKENSGRVNNLLVSSFTNSTQLIVMIVFEVFFSNILSLLFVAIFLAFLASMSRKIPLKYSHHFKVNVYLTTIYAFVMLILSLFNLGSLSLIALMIVYFYHFRVYNSVRLIPTVKGGGNSE